MSRRFAPTATTAITLMPARLTATTDLTGLRAECLLAPARGMAGDVVGVGVVGDMVGTVAAAGAMVVAAGVDAASAADVAFMAAADLPTPVLAASTVVAASTVAVVADSTVAVVADSTVAVEVGSTVVAADTVAADTANRRPVRNS
jgi:hypothetical protein